LWVEFAGTLALWCPLFRRWWLIYVTSLVLHFR
jgi:hypothetical protein